MTNYIEFASIDSVEECCDHILNIMQLDACCGNPILHKSCILCLGIMFILNIVQCCILSVEKKAVPVHVAVYDDFKPFDTDLSK